MRRGCVCLELDDGCRTRCAPMWWPLETADEAGVDVGSVSVGSQARLGSQCRCGIHRIRPRGNFPDLSIRPWVGHSRTGTPDRPRTDIEARGSRRDDLSDDRHGVDAGAAARARRYPRGGASQNRVGRRNAEDPWSHEGELPPVASLPAPRPARSPRGRVRRHLESVRRPRAARQPGALLRLVRHRRRRRRGLGVPRLTLRRRPQHACVLIRRVHRRIGPVTRVAQRRVLHGRRGSRLRALPHPHVRDAHQEVHAGALRSRAARINRRRGARRRIGGASVRRRASRRGVGGRAHVRVPHRRGVQGGHVLRQSGVRGAFRCYPAHAPRAPHGSGGGGNGEGVLGDVVRFDRGVRG